MQIESAFRFPQSLSPFHLLRPEAERPLLLVCDHASAEVPPELERLGLPEGELRRHIGWDPGAAALTAELSRLLGATAVLAGVSRLVIDCNREPGHPTSICGISDGTRVPLNQDLSPQQAEQRVQCWYQPYQSAIAEQLTRLERQGAKAALIAIHSFTPCMAGCSRPWPVGVLWNQDGRVALPLIQQLRDQGWNCGDNQPYSGRTANHTTDRHGQDQGRLHVSIEVRQDELIGQAGIALWADCLTQALDGILAEL